MNLNDLNTFCLVAETGTISGAARRLAVPKSTVSRRVSRLEDALGHELLRRSARSVSLTERGQRLVQHSGPLLRELSHNTQAILSESQEPSGTLRITTVPGFGHNFGFLECIKTFGLQYPKVTINLELTTRLVALVDEGFDLGVRLHTGPLPGSPDLMSRHLLNFGRALYASPDYLATQGHPRRLEDLANHHLAGHAIVDLRNLEWVHRGDRVSLRDILPVPRWLINDHAALERFALSGGGLTILSTLDGDQLVEDGSLVRVLPEYTQTGGTASLIWPASKHLAPRIRAFIDHAVATMGSASTSTTCSMDG